ncbi:MAG: hypothetical protein M1819_001660 [Sarea resinae]|nr:MAG: hypothetical protein M1819_001660 [Sarea resinae]
MHFSIFLTFQTACLLLIGLASTTPTPSAYSGTALSARSSTCSGNTASDRSQWCDYDLSTNYYTDGPDTGNTVEYWFNLVNTTASPDGVERNVLLVNGSFPGPTIEANWGDTVVVHVTNSLTYNGTGIHFHGVRQNYTNQMDGVPSITQCPLAPGETYTYTWKATQYGSSWYHSHYSLQAWEGIFGGIVIHGPATANYDTDLGSLFLNDWSHETADALYSEAATSGSPTLDNGLINGTNTYDDGGSRFETTFEEGRTYLIRLVNAGIDSHFKFSLDNHTMTVIATDFVPIVPYTTEVLSIGMGQRYDILITANQSSSSSYWLRAIPQTTCSNNDNPTDIKGIVRYSSNSTNATTTTDPTTSAYDYTDSCLDESSSSLVPYLSLTPEVSSEETTLPVTVTLFQNLFKWSIGSQGSMRVSWSDPTLLQLSNTTWANSSSVITLPDANEWTALIIETTNSLPHPIHLHGHDFYILDSGTGTYNSSIETVTNPPRRDVAMLPGSGYLILAFKTDNPGAWLMHCHIGWHSEEGFALQFLERQSEISALIDEDILEETCSAWDTWVDNGGLEEGTGVSGI